MMTTGKRLCLTGAVALGGVMIPHASLAQTAETPAPQVFLDKSPKIVAFQLKRLTNPQLLAVERKPDAEKYRPVYEAILIRKGVERRYRQESAEGLAAIGKSNPVVEILVGIGKTETEEDATRADLVGLLLTQKPASLAAEKGKIQSLAEASASLSLREAALASLVVADGNPDAVWQAVAKPEERAALLGGVAMLPDPALRGAFYPLVSPLLTVAEKESPVRIAALDAIGFIPGHESEVFAALANIVRTEQGPARDAAVRSIRRIPADKWPSGVAGPMANDVIKLVGTLPTDDRATPAGIELIQLGEDLAATLPPAEGKTIRKSLRELGVRTILLRTLKEQMAYDLRYFVVQAGKPVQIVLDNPDAMPHNVVITAPGAVQEVGSAGGLLQPPSDPAAKAFVPELPSVLFSSHLVQPGKSETLRFEAPKQPGEYGYVCTFPGHWVRMYGVMLVVDDLEAFEQSPKPPTDPLTKKPIESAKQISLEPAPEHHH